MILNFPTFSFYNYRTIKNFLVFKVFTAATMKNAVFRDVASCGPYKNRRLAHSEQNLLSPCLLAKNLKITIEELLERKSSGSGLENREYGRDQSR
jgi:hypothetical protein